MTDCYTPNIEGDAEIDLKNPRNTLIPNTNRRYPDHMNNKFIGAADNNGVHVNAAILKKLFIL
jgi:neutral peptidase B